MLYAVQYGPVNLQMDKFVISCKLIYLPTG